MASHPTTEIDDHVQVDIEGRCFLAPKKSSALSRFWINKQSELNMKHLNELLIRKIYEP